MTPDDLLLQYEETYESLQTGGSIPTDTTNHHFQVCDVCFKHGGECIYPNPKRHQNFPRPCCLKTLNQWAKLGTRGIQTRESLVREVRLELVAAAMGMTRSHRMVRKAILEWDKATLKSDILV